MDRSTTAEPPGRPDRRVRRRLVGAFLLLAALTPTVAVCRAEPDPLVECETAFAADPDGWNSCGCFFVAGRRPGLRAAADRRLAAHLAASPGNPCLHFNLGRLRFLAGDHSAGDLLRAAAELYAAAGEAAGEVYARINRGRFLRLQGRKEAATAELDAARRAAFASNDTALEAQVGLEEAQVRLEDGEDLERIDRLLRRVEAKAFPDGLLSLRRDTLQELGHVRYLLGRYAEAETYYRRMAELARETGNAYGEAAALESLTAARLARGPGRGAREATAALLREALEAAERAGHRSAEAGARLRLGRMLGGEEGRRLIDSSVLIARQLGDADTLARGLESLAVNRLAEDPAAARRLIDEALAVALESPHHDSAAYGWSYRLAVAWAARPREEAVAEGFALLRLIERIRDLQRAEKGRVEVFAVWTQVYYALSGRLLASEPADPERAFAVTERMRARVLLEALAGARPAPPADPELREVLERLVEVNRRLLDAGLGAAERAAALAELEALERREAGLRDRGAPALGSVRLGPSDFASLARIEEALEPEEALLSFQVAPWRDVYGNFAGGAWLLAVTRAGSRIYPLPGRAELEPQLRVFQNLFARRDGSEAEPARSLFDALLRPALDDLPAGTERLILVPDGALHRLPFAALRTAEGVPFAERYRLSVVPSATLWLRWRGTASVAGSPAGSRVLVLADPRSPGGVGVPGSAAPGAVAERSSLLTRGVRLEALPHARAEGRAAVRHLGHPSELLIGDAASEKTLKTIGTGDFGVLHFAAHAVIDGERPHRSAVVLSPGGPGEDGLLQPREIAGLDLRGSVVVLSTCRSAAGAVLAGEGPLSLARAFFAAGARTVVASLWPLRDDEAAELFAAFYRHLGRGASVAAALAAAQVDRLAAGAPAAAWAGVGVFGDGDVVPMPGGGGAGGWLPVAAGVGLLTAILVGLGWSIRRFRRAWGHQAQTARTLSPAFPGGSNPARRGVAAEPRCGLSKGRPHPAQGRP